MNFPPLLVQFLFFDVFDSSVFFFSETSWLSFQKPCIGRFYRRIRSGEVDDDSNAATKVPTNAYRHRQNVRCRVVLVSSLWRVLVRVVLGFACTVFITRSSYLARFDDTDKLPRQLVWNLNLIYCAVESRRVSFLLATFCHCWAIFQYASCCRIQGDGRLARQISIQGEWRDIVNRVRTVFVLWSYRVWCTANLKRKFIQKPFIYLFGCFRFWQIRRRSRYQLLRRKQETVRGKMSNNAKRDRLTIQRERFQDRIFFTDATRQVRSTFLPIWPPFSNGNVGIFAVV